MLSCFYMSLCDTYANQVCSFHAPDALNGLIYRRLLPELSLTENVQVLLLGMHNCW